MLSHFDRTNQVPPNDLQYLSSHLLTSDPLALSQADIFIVTVPTPIDNTRRPDLTPLKSACRTVGVALKNRRSVSKPLVIFESTVFPTCTEDICVPILEEYSQLTFNHDFFCGYSPERINPGDNDHKLSNIIKVTSGSNSSSASWIDNFYSSFISAGTYLASSIQVAEAAKVIENTQRDLNIDLLMNYRLFSKN